MSDRGSMRPDAIGLGLGLDEVAVKVGLALCLLLGVGVPDLDLVLGYDSISSEQIVFFHSIDINTEVLCASMRDGMQSVNQEHGIVRSPSP